MKTKVIIFDMDGVIFDSIGLAAQSLSTSYPGLTSAMQKELLTGNFRAGLKKITIPRIVETDEGKAVRRLKYAKDKLEAPMYPGAKDLLEDLHKRAYILVINTLAYDRNCIPLLEKAGIKEFFDFLATGETSDSKVDQFKIILEKYSLDAKEALFVTDTLGDLREADVVGVPTVAVTWGAHDRSYFGREEHKNLIGIVDSFAELRTFILGR